MSKTIYIHTIDGKPACFDGNQICYASFYGPRNKPAYSLKEIRDQQRKTKSYREKRGWEYISYDYSYIRYWINE